MLNTNLPSWPSYTQEEADAVSEVLLSNKVNYWTGQECRLFEDEFANHLQCKHAIGLANGTLALDLALYAIDIQPEDEVIVTPRTFIASVSSVVTSGANPVFADIDVNSQNITAETIEKVITKKTKAIIVVHLAGMPAEMGSIMALAKKHNLKVIEDCAQAHGAKYKNTPVGTIGDIGAWSFCQDKIMTTGGEGGMVTTNDKALWSKMWSYKDHGKSWDSIYNKEHKPGFRWIHDSIGTNWRMTELQAVIGRIQLTRLTSWSIKRRINANMIWNKCHDYDWLRVPTTPKHCEHAAYKAYVFIQPESLGTEWSRDIIIDKLNSYGIPVYSGSCSEVYLEKAFDNSSYKPAKRLPNAKLLGETSLMFLVHPTIESKHMQKVLEALDKINLEINN